MHEKQEVGILALLFGEKEPLKEQLSEAVGSLKTVGAKIEVATGKLQERAKRLFEETAEYYAKGDATRAAMYANEVSLVRKLSKKFEACRLALEMIEIRVETVIESGNIAAALHPVMDVIADVRREIGSVIPEVDTQLNTINSSLEQILSSTLHTDVKTLETLYKTESADEVLQEVRNMVGEQKENGLPVTPEAPVEESTSA